MLSLVLRGSGTLKYGPWQTEGF